MYIYFIENPKFTARTDKISSLNASIAFQKSELVAETLVSGYVTCINSPWDFYIILSTTKCSCQEHQSVDEECKLIIMSYLL